MSLIPAVRLFVLLGLSSLLFAAAALVPWLLAVAIAADLGLLLLALLDWLRARRCTLDAERVWPASLVQGQPAEIGVELRFRSVPQATRVRLSESLHPSLALAPLRKEMVVEKGSTRARWQYEIVPQDRGAHEVAPLWARLLGPWGLSWYQCRAIEAETRRVLPRIRWGGRVGQLLALAHRQELGSISLRRHGPGSEFYGLRPYQAGDPRNIIDWKASARAAELVSREYTWESGGALLILLDCARAMVSERHRRTKLDHAVATVLALCRVAAGRGDRVTILAFSDQIDRRVRIRPGSKDSARAYEQLYDLGAKLVEPVYDLAVEEALESAGVRSTIVMLTSVVDLAAAELLRTSLLRLRRRHRPLLVNLEDPEVEELAFGAPDDVPAAYAKLSSLDILLNNRLLARRLRGHGVEAVTTSADRLALETLETYLSMVEAG